MVHQTNVSSNRTVRGIVIHAKLRSGSTFTSQMFLSDPNIYYIFEPVHLLEPREWKDVRKVLKVLYQSLQCDFESLPINIWAGNAYYTYGSGGSRSGDLLASVRAAAEKCRRSQLTVVKVNDQAQELPVLLYFMIYMSFQILERSQDFGWLYCPELEIVKYKETT